MISINKTFKLGNNLILAPNDSHNFKINDIVVDESGYEYKVIGIPIRTNSLCVEPLNGQSKEIKYIRLAS